jgi:hypothetical protein
MSWTSDLVGGLAQHIEDAGLGVYRPDGSAYQAGEIAIVVGILPPVPDRLIVLTAYAATRPLGLADTSVSVQVRARGPAGDSRAAAAVLDPVHELLDGVRNLTLGGVRVVQILHGSGPAPIGLDSSNRPELTDNFTVQAERPTGNFPD